MNIFIQNPNFKEPLLQKFIQKQEAKSKIEFEQYQIDNIRSDFFKFLESSFLANEENLKSGFSTLIFEAHFLSLVKKYAWSQFPKEDPKVNYPKVKSIEEFLAEVGAAK